MVCVLAKGQQLILGECFIILPQKYKISRGPLSDSLALVHKQKKSPELTENIRDLNNNLPNPVCKNLG